ncbi:hypothetical protein [Haladaptatus sp. DJG-WS-42]|uniref:hypothetical protein n=1 Tax=Haladaptatus sp. DJG-WS-42 TaxID=3120516 RepID=UPI0030CF26ED
MGNFDGFISFLETELGDQLRIARYHHDETHHLLIARRDVRDSRAEYVPKISSYLTESGEQTISVEDTFGLGAVHWSVARFDDALILRFYFQENTGVTVSMEPDADLDLLAFAERCADELEPIETLSPRF